MPVRAANRLSLLALFALTLTALGVILAGALAGGFAAPPPGARADEGTGAHIFQLAVAATLPAGLAYLASAAWDRPLRALRALVLPALALLLAFALLWHFEHPG